MTVEECENGIIDICQELSDFASAVSKLPMVSHLSQATIQFYGGVFGAIKEQRELKRLEKLINLPIYQNKSFYQYYQILILKTGRMVDLVVEIQRQTTPQDAIYYSVVDLVVKSTELAIAAWHNYSPDMASAAITVDGQKGVSLWPTVRHYTIEEYKRMNVTEGYALPKDHTVPAGGGCFGVLIALLLIPSTLVALLTMV